MTTNLEQLFKRDIFESFKVVSGKNYLNKKNPYLHMKGKVSLI